MTTPANRHSDRERALITNIDLVIDDLNQPIQTVGETHPGLPIVLVGHSMGALITTCYAQAQGSVLAALAVSAPLIGSHASDALLAFASFSEIPDRSHCPLERGVGYCRCAA